MYSFDLAKYNAVIGDRFIVFDDINKKVFKKIIIKNGNKIQVNFKEVLKNPDGFKFKFQKLEDDKWRDIHKYFKLTFPHKIGDFWSDKLNFDEENLINSITYFTHSKTTFSRVRLLKSFKQVCEDLWLRHTKSHKNLNNYFDFVNKNKEIFNEEWENINVYIKYLLRLKVKFQSLGYHQLYFYELQPKLLNDKNIIDFIHKEIEMLEAQNLQFAYLLIAQYYSLLNERKKAADYFKLVKDYDNNLETEFLIGQGASTYKLLGEDRQLHQNNVQFYNDIDNIGKNNTVLVSVDSKYLKRYGTMIFFTVIALQKYHFHIHVVGDNDITTKTINEAIQLFNQIKDFTGKVSEIITPTFSYEELPEYANSIKSFSATARFINASYFMEKFNTNLLILDADIFLTDDLKSYFNTINKYDIAIAFSKSVTTTLPWRRLMAGNIYLSNNEKAKKYIDLTRDYIVDNLKEKQSWTLDQNALTYAYEEIHNYYKDITFGNVYEFNRPFSHPKLRTYIERK